MPEPQLTYFTMRVNSNETEPRGPLDNALSLLNAARYEESLKEAKRILHQELPQNSKGTLHFVIGSSYKGLGEINQAMIHFLEGYAIIAQVNQPAILGHFQDEIARILFDAKAHNASLFFIQMAIDNFEIAGVNEMKESCLALQEELLFLL